MSVLEMDTFPGLVIFFKNYIFENNLKIVYKEYFYLLEKLRKVLLISYYNYYLTIRTVYKYICI